MVRDWSSARPALEFGLLSLLLHKDDRAQPPNNVVIVDSPLAPSAITVRAFLSPIQVFVIEAPRALPLTEK